jgi:hypothetical protein
LVLYRLICKLNWKKSDFEPTSLVNSRFKILFKMQKAYHFFKNVFQTSKYF